MLHTIGQYRETVPMLTIRPRFVASSAHLQLFSECVLVLARMLYRMPNLRQRERAQADGPVRARQETDTHEPQVSVCYNERNYLPLLAWRVGDFVVEIHLVLVIMTRV